MIIYKLSYLLKYFLNISFHFYISKSEDMYSVLIKKRSPISIMLLGFWSIMYLSVQFNA